MACVDVMIPCYNYARYLPESVGSVLSQGIDNVRVVVIDNASTDNSVEVARRLAEADSRIEVVCHEKNLGPHASFNEGIDLAKAEYMMILCADDILAPGALRRGLEALESDPQAAFAVGVRSELFEGKKLPAAEDLPEGSEVFGGPVYIEQCCWSVGDNSGAHAMLVRRRSQKSAGYYRASLTHMDDLEMALRLACVGSVARLRAPIVTKRVHSANLLSAVWDDRLADLREREAAFESFFRREGWTIDHSVRLQRIARRRIAETVFWSAASHFYRGKWTEGRQLLKYSLRIKPSMLLVPPVGHLLRGGAARRMSDVLLREAR